MNNHPISFAEQMYVNEHTTQPSEIKMRNNVESAMWKRYLWYMIYSVFEFKIPDYWELNWFRFFLFRFGSIAVIWANNQWVCNPYSVSKFKLYYKPQDIQCVSQFWDSPKRGIVGLNCGIIRLLDDWWTLEDIVNEYSAIFAQIRRTVNVNLLNTNLSLLSEVRDPSQAKDVKQAYADATMGKPLVIVNKSVELKDNLSSPFDVPFKVNDVLLAEQTLWHKFLTTIGIKNTNYDKKERLTTDEVAENNDETKSLVMIMRDNLRKTFDEVNAVTGLGLDFKLRYDYESKSEPGKGDGDSDDNA